MGQVTHDTLHTTNAVGMFSRYFGSLALTVWELRCFENLEGKDEKLNQLISVWGVCRTALVTPGLLY